ncbi:MAG: 3'(2'),5'-bisphosphate nucleotidase [Planctomycetota bacterium]|nr:3'(2'),5'-bisphosphate nucleotidase [Planctomycetota bacterium]
MAHQVDYDDRLKAARRAVQEACVVCRAVQTDLENLRSLTKDDRSPVTVADFASQAVIARRLREELGEIRMVAEEDVDALRGDANTAIRQRVVDAVRLVWPEASEADVLDAIDIGTESDAHASIFWTLDPIDGTKGFLRRGQYAISLGWIEAGEPTLGVLGCPNLSADFSRPFDDPDPIGCIYFAYKGTGLYEAPANDADAPGQRLRRLEHDESDAVRICESVESEHSSQSDSQKVVDYLGRRHETYRLDSQAKYAVVARGQADAYLRMPTRKGYVEKIWDHAAGALMATESGCAVTDVSSRLLEFNHGARLEANRGIVCAPSALHGQLVDAIQKLGLDRSG